MAAERIRFPHEFKEIDPAVRQEHVYPNAVDGYPLRGIFYLPPKSKPDTAVLVMHPRGDFTRHYLAPRVVGAGYAFFGCGTRYFNNDADALHERLMLDVAGAVSFLKERGMRKIILAGNSGGGSLFALYLQQANKKPAERLSRAPSGDRVDLGKFDLPQADGIILLAAHRGEGEFLMARLDPSVVDEANPTAVNPRLDMYHPANGYRPMEQGPSKYSKDFLAEFRAAQRARCERLDRQALEWCEEARYFKAKLRGEGLSEEEAYRATRYGLQRRYLVIYRTLADPRYLDLSLDPSDRPIGSLFSYGQDPVKGNYGEGLSRVMSARGWLSTWSGLSSNAALERTMPGVSQSTLAINSLADTEIFPSDVKDVFAVAAAKDKTYKEISWGDHYFRPVGEQGAKMGDPIDRLCDEIILPWIKERWPV